MAKRVGQAVCVCVCWRHATHLSKSSWAETEREREEGRQLHCSTAGSLCACRITNFPGDQGQQQPPLSMPHAVLSHATLSVAGSIELRQSQRAHLLASSLNVQSAPAAAAGCREFLSLSLPAACCLCCCSCCHCNVCNFLINAIMS